VETLVHADIFFLITSIFVGVLIVGSAVSLFFIIPILRDLRHLSAVARREGDKIAGDIDDLRDAAREEGVKVRSIFDFVLGLFIRRQDLKRKKTTN